VGELLHVLKFLLVNWDHSWNSILLGQILHSRKLSPLKLFRIWLNQAGLAVSYWMLLLLLYAAKLTHVYCLCNDVILLENNSWLLLLIDILCSTSAICIHLQAIHYLGEVLLLHGKLAWSSLLVQHT
jgi:hypothetical protein